MGKKAALLAVALAVAGLCILLWPVVSGHRLQADMSAAAQGFLEEARQSYPELLADLQGYNQRIYTERQAGLADALACEEPAVLLRDYGVEDEVIGVLEIPTLELVMPVYLGASDSHLAAGAAVLGNTSAPIGGVSTNCVMRRMYAYLTKHRCIDRDVVTAFVQEKMLYEDDPHHNCVFVGLDENGEARHAHLRSTGSQGKVFRINVESSDIKHSFHKNGTDRSLYVFEAPIDLLSHITLYPAGWLEHSYVACCGTSIQPVLERLRQNPKLDTVYLCLDNDEAGEDACDGMLDTLEDMGYDVERLRPEGRDWNDDLRAKRGKAKTPTA